MQQKFLQSENETNKSFLNKKTRICSVFTLKIFFFIFTHKIFLSRFYFQPFNCRKGSESIKAGRQVDIVDINQNKTF